MNKNFVIKSEFRPSGDQPAAIRLSLLWFSKKKKDQVLLGVTGSGKTFTMANIINNFKDLPCFCTK